MDKIYHIRSSKATLILTIATLVNFLLVFAVQMLFYTIPPEITPEVLAKKDSSFEGCTIHDTLDLAADKVLLIERSDGTYQLLTFEKHLLLPRYRLVQRCCPTFGFSDQVQGFSVKTMNGSAWIEVARTYLGETSQSLSLGGGLKYAALIAAALTAVELLAAGWLSKIGE